MAPALVRAWCKMPTNILVINPNSTASMTADIAAAARSKALPGTQITAVNPADGPMSIQGQEDGQACLPGLFELFDRIVGSSSDFDAVIIACFDDTGLAELKSRSNIPIIGIGEAAFHAATLVGPKFSTVTTLAVSIPIIEDNIARYGFANQSVRVHASNVPVLDIGDETAHFIETKARKAIAEDGCDAIVLGCAGMADLADDLSQSLGLPVIDGVTMAVAFCEALTRARARAA